MKTFQALLRRLKYRHQLSIRRARIHYRNRSRNKAPHHTQLHFESILK